MRTRSGARSIRATAALAAAVLVVLSSVGPVGADTERELKAARAQLDEVLDRMEANRGAIETLQSEAGALTARIDEVESRAAETQGKIANAQLEVRQAEMRLAAVQGQLDRRARLAFQHAPGTSLEFVLGSTSLADLTARMEIVDQAAESDHELVVQIREMRRDFRGTQRRFEALRQELLEAEAGLAATYEALEEKLGAAQGVYQQLATDRLEAERLVRKFERKRRAEIEAERRRLAELARQRRLVSGGGGGGYVSGIFQFCPVQGAVAYSDEFGAPRFTGGFHPHAGNDIFAPHGTPVVAPFDGVAEVATNGIGGMSVKVFGELGWVYNAHLSGIETLGRVAAGTVIGYVGATGNAAGTPPHNHFEWHPKVVPADPWTSPYGYSQVRTAIDPYPYLNSVC